MRWYDCKVYNAYFDKLIHKLIVTGLNHFYNVVICSTSTTTSTTQSTTTEDNKKSFRNKTGIKSIVDNEILQLKSDLDQLLKFNENLLHFDSSIVKNAAKNKVEKFMKKLSATIEHQLSDDTNENTEKMEAASNILRYLWI